MSYVTVKDLIAFLRTKPKDMPVAYKCYSEQALLELHEIEVREFCEPRGDGWVHSKRPDKPSIPYLLFPGN